jgi:hypothetical protein
MPSVQEPVILKKVEKTDLAPSAQARASVLATSPSSDVADLEEFISKQLDELNRLSRAENEEPTISNSTGNGVLVRTPSFPPSQPISVFQAVPLAPHDNPSTRISIRTSRAPRPSLDTPTRPSLDTPPRPSSSGTPASHAPVDLATPTNANRSSISIDAGEGPKAAPLLPFPYFRTSSPVSAAPNPAPVPIPVTMPAPVQLSSATMPASLPTQSAPIYDPPSGTQRIRFYFEAVWMVLPTT